MVEYITIHDKKYPVRIGYYVMKKVKEETGESLSEIFKTKDSLDPIHETILYAALQVGAFAEKQELDLKREDMEMILDLCFTDYMKAFSSDKFFPKEDVAELEAKMKKADKNLGKGKKGQAKRTTPVPKKSST
jgi:hypothetical protein